MKLQTIVLGLSSLWLFAFTSSFHWTYRPNAAPFIVVLDAGHGGKDPGCSGAKSKEKDIALNIALQVEQLLNANKVFKTKAILTRKSDEFIGLSDRAKIANNQKADLFISVHCNANDNHEILGTETYAMGLHKNNANLNVMMNENSSILLEDNYKQKYDGFDPKSEEAYIIFKLHQHSHVKQSLDLASKIESNFKAKRTSRGVKQAGFLVLWQTSMPSVLIETGFLTNKTDEKFLSSVEGRRHIASAIYKSVNQYIEERRQNQ